MEATAKCVSSLYTEVDNIAAFRIILILALISR
jgi:hypothetical protein